MMHHSSLFPWTYARSWFAGRRARASYADLRCYAMFIGQPRSGTSLIGSLLNAHRNMCVVQELNALKYLRRGYDRWQLFWLLMHRDREFAAGGRRWTGYDYEVPNQWQGRTEKLLVIGDKKAGASTDQFRKDPRLLERLKTTVGLPVRMIHVIRDPYNVITTMHHRKNISLERSAEIFFRRSQTNWQLMQSLGDSVLTFKLENLIVEPHRHLRNMCHFLGVDAPDDYIDACAGILFAKPKQTKTQAPWPAELISSVAREIKKYPFLDGYEYGGSSETARSAA